MPTVPVGVITIWSGAIVDIPAGWILCDGGGGSPDLRDRFVPGAGGIYNPDDTGGSDSHNHTFTTDGHFHSIPAGVDINAGITFAPATNISTDTGTTNTKNHLPPFYALAYIMKT